MASRSSTMAQLTKKMTTRTQFPLVPSTGWGTTTFHTLPKISSRSLLKSLSRKGKGTIEDAQLLTLQGIMEADLNNLQPVQEKKHSSTWPPKCSKRAQTLQAHCPQLTQMMDYVKNPLAQAFDVECDSVGKGSGWHTFASNCKSFNSPQTLPEKVSMCQHLSLGSILNLELPKDPTALRNIHDTISIAQEGLTDRKEASQASGMAQCNISGGNIQPSDTRVQKRRLGVQKPLGTGDVQRKFQKKERGTWFEEVSCNPSYSRQKVDCTAPCEEDRKSPKSRSSSSDEYPDFRQNQLSRISVLHEQLGWEWDRLAATLGTTGSITEGWQEKEPTEHTVKAKESPGVKVKPSPAANRSTVDASSSTAKLMNLAPNAMPNKETSQGALEGSCEKIPPSWDSHGIQPTKVSLFDCELGRQEGILASSGLDSLVEAPGGNTVEGPKLPGRTGICHPAHELFEEEEEELQAIWSNMEKHKRSAGVHGGPERKADKAQSPGDSSGKIILTAAENVLVAKFKLPTLVQPLQVSEEVKGYSNGLGRKSSSTQCRASLPSGPELSEKTEVAPVGTMSSIYPGDQLKFQEESRGVNKLPPSKLELQMMEGTLERKHLLQAGGRKANCRSWNTFHTVLMRQTLCFYQDKKDTLKQSSMVALPLNLCGAICALETEYTKKTNCFTLLLKDGSKYLLRALTEPLMKEWVTKLQQNSGLPEVDYFQSASQATQRTTSAVSVIPGLGSSHCRGPHQHLTAKSQEEPRSSVKLQLLSDTQDDPLDSTAPPAGNNQRSATIYTAEQNPKLCSSTESPRAHDPFMFQEDDCGLVTSKRRSYSFTSATYQKISPVSVSKEPLGVGSSYSVTLYIGEQAPAILRPRCHSFMATPGGIRETLSERSQGTSPRQKNKSVFRKFFGKKD